MRLAGMSAVRATAVLGLLCAFVVGTVLVSAMPVSAQQSGKPAGKVTPSPGKAATTTTPTTTTTTSTKPAAIPPTKHIAEKLTVDRWHFGVLFLEGVGYKPAAFTQYFDGGGNSIGRAKIAKGSMVNIEYYEGGTPTEAYPFHPGDKVLISVRKMR